MSLHLSNLNHEIRVREDPLRGHFRQEITRGQNRGEKTIGVNHLKGIHDFVDIEVMSNSDKTIVANFSVSPDQTGISDVPGITVLLNKKTLFL